MTPSLRVPPRMELGAARSGEQALFCLGREDKAGLNCVYRIAYNKKNASRGRGPAAHSPESSP